MLSQFNLRKICLFLVFLIYLQVSAQKNTDKLNHYQVLPSGFYTPETNIGLGIIGLMYHQPVDSLTNQSNAQVYLDFTLNKQFQFQSDLNWFTHRNEFYIKWAHDISKFPEIFHGVGNETMLTDACPIDFNLYNFNLKIFKKLKRKHYLGINAHHQSLLNITKHGPHAWSPELMEYAFSGLGAEFLIDQRDFLLNPQNGKYIELGLTPYFSHLDKRSYLQFVSDLRFYKTIKSNWILNTNVVAVETFGDIPFRMMPAIGGPRFLRGFYYGRFRDNNLLLGQAELRRPLFWRIGIAAFGGIGKVYSSLSEIGTVDYHHNYGAGLRIRVDEESKANIRIDYGRTADSQGFYIVYGEAF